MAEDWRVTFTIDESGPVSIARAFQELHEYQVEREARDRLGGCVAVSGDDDHIFLYADTEAAAGEAKDVVVSLLAAHDLAVEGDVIVERWHPLEERWEDARVPLPSTAAEQEAEHERLQADETAESLATGVAAWEVRIEFGSHHDAAEFGERLEQEGRSVVRRWTFLLVGANNEDDARALARELELPADAVIHVEPGSEPVWEALGNNPFAIFGGLAG